MKSLKRNVNQVIKFAIPKFMSSFQFENPIHVTARSNNRDWFAAPLDKCWEVFVKSIADAEKRYGFKTHAFVLMSNHYHWLLSLEKDNRGAGMCYFQTTTSRGIARLAGRINRIYGARYSPTVINEPIHFANAYRYIYQNPLRAKICAKVEDYPWSTLTNPTVKTSRCGEFGNDIPWEQLSAWLNTPVNNFDNDRIQKALRRKTFRYPRDRQKGRSEIVF